MRTNKRRKQNRPPTKLKHQPSAGAPKPPSPSPETLAMIAATCSKGGREYPETAVDYAAKLYKAACEHLDYEKRASQAKAQEIAETPLPAKFPATFDNWLRLVVKAKTLREANNRFRDYRRDMHRDSFKGAELEHAVDLDEAEWRRQGFYYLDDWLKYTRSYLHWWEHRKSEQARAAASKTKLKQNV